jgi:hypothetical protein
MIITDMDIATVEALHDLLLDKHGYPLSHVTLTRARALAAKMYDLAKIERKPEWSELFKLVEKMREPK